MHPIDLVKDRYAVRTQMFIKIFFRENTFKKSVHYSSVLCDIFHEFGEFVHMSVIESATLFFE